MNSYYPSKKPNTRIDVADVLRGIAIGGIILIHFVEHMNFFSYPEPSSAFWAGVNSAVQDVIFFLFAGKMYAIFALLFGLSFLYSTTIRRRKAGISGSDLCGEWSC